ncbi:MAG: hypothetical protein R3A79_25940 [Nannocystaceae bacterium]
MAEAPLSLLLEGGGLLLIAEDRLLAPGVRLRHARIRPTGAASPAEILSGGPGRVARLLARPVIVERCVFGIRGEALAEALARRLLGVVIGGREIVDVAAELGGTRLPALDLRISLRGGEGSGRQTWGARVDLRVRGAQVVAGWRTPWLLPGTIEEAAAIGRALAARLGSGGRRGCTLEGRRLAQEDALDGATVRLPAADVAGGAHHQEVPLLVIDPLALLVDPWLIRGGHRPLRVRPGLRARIRAERGELEVALAEGAVAAPLEDWPTVTSAAADPVEALLAALRRGDAEAYAQMAESGGRWLPESAAWESAVAGRALPLGIAALERAAAEGSARARRRLPILRGLAGDRRGLAEDLARAWRVESHPVVRGRLRIAWALAIAGEPDGVARARRELEGLVGEFSDGRWPSSFVGEGWGALAALRAADPGVSAELAVAAAVEASLHQRPSRGGETLLEVALEIYERGDAVAEAVAWRARRAGLDLVDDLDPELADRLRRWREPSPI